MDANRFDAFAESGDLFNRAIAAKRRGEIPLRSNTRGPAESFIAFSGHLTIADALLKNRGLT